MFRLLKYIMITGLGLILTFFIQIWVAPVYGETVSPRKTINLERIFPEYYPKKFSGTGWIDRIGENEIVINDFLHMLSSHVRYGSLKERSHSKSSLRQGMAVGYILNKRGEIVSLWLLEE